MFPKKKKKKQEKKKLNKKCVRSKVEEACLTLDELTLEAASVLEDNKEESDGGEQDQREISESGS